MEHEDDFLFDFAVILHSHTADLVNISQWIEGALNYLGQSPFKYEYEVTPLEVEEVLVQPVGELLKAIERIYEKVGDNWTGREIPEEFKTTMDEIYQTMRRYVGADPGARFRAPYMRSQINALLSVCPKKRDVNLANKLVEDLRDRAKEIQRILCFYDISTAISKIREMELQTKNLCEFYSNSFRPSPPPERYQVISTAGLIRLVIRERGGFAHARNIDIDLAEETHVKDAKIKIVKQDMLRALSHILNNAIKYNYTLRNNRVWVAIRVYRASHGMIAFEFENWGVPITEDELEKGLIYRLGWRGTYAGIKGKGNGIGLTDARRVIQNHSGTISISSVPARRQVGRTLDYDKPFITIVKVEIPEYITTH